jgi:ribonuclease P protein component
VKRAWRLKAESDVQRVWQQGRAFAHPLVILRVRENGLAQSRAAFVAGKKIGKAVKRNRAKRRLREAVRPQFPEIPNGYDCVFIARGNILDAAFTDIVDPVAQVLRRAKLFGNDSKK